MNTGTALLVENMRETCSNKLRELGKNIQVYGMIDQEPSFDQVVFWMGGDVNAAKQFQAWTKLYRTLSEIALDDEIMAALQE